MSRNSRQRRLYHEPLEPRRLLTGPDPGWVFNAGGIGSATVLDMQADVAGNIYVVGGAGTLDFDPGPGVAPSSGGSYLAKYTADGSFLWAREGNWWLYAADVLTLDADGNAYVVGTGAGVAKFDAAGNLLWDTAELKLGAQLVAVDTAGYVYAAGDRRVSKLDNNGELIWTFEIPYTGEKHSYGLAVAPDSSIYITGYFNGTANFGSHQLVTSGFDGFIAKLATADGEVLWARTIVNGNCRGITVDSENNVYATGAFTGTAYFDSFELISQGGTEDNDFWAGRLNAEGTFMWVRGAGGDAASDDEFSFKIVVDAGGNIYTSGVFTGAVDFDPGPGVALLVNPNGLSNAYWDGFLWKLDADGNYLTAKRFGGTRGDKAYALALDAQGNVFLGGDSNSPTMDFPNGTLTLISDELDMFVAKLPARTCDMRTVLFSDSFENGEWNGKWVEDSQNDWYTSTRRTTLGSYSAEVDGVANDAKLTIANPVNLTPYGSAELTFNWFIETEHDAGEYVALDLYDGTNWTEVARLAGDVDVENVWHSKTIAIDASYLGANFRFRFRATASGSDEDANVDNVELVATSLAGPWNNVPVAVSDSYSVTEDHVLVTPAPGVLGNDSDPEMSPMSASLLSDVTAGTLALHADGSFEYTPDPNFNGTDSFRYRASDGAAYSNMVTVTITVDPVNDAPVAHDQSLGTRLSTARSITLTASDVELDPLSYSVVTGPQHGTLSGTAPNLIYMPDLDYAGMDSFTFLAHDGMDASNVATVTIDVTANHIPEAIPQSVSLDEDCPQSITLAGYDADADPLSFQLLSLPLHGTLSGTAPDLVYTPEANYNGSDSFLFLVNDGTADSLPATVSITIAAINDAPQADAQSLTTSEDTPLSITLTGSDVEGATLTFYIYSQPSHGTLSGVAPDLVYTPNSEYSGPDSFTFRVRDGVVNSAPATISLVVEPVNDAPVAMDDEASTPIDTPVVIPVLANDNDVDSGALWINSLGTPAHGALVDNGDGTVTYTPAAGYLGPDTFDYSVTDGELTDVATVTIDVQPNEVTLVYSNTTSKTIKDRAKTTSTISVPDAMSIVDVNVQLNISHTRDQDLDVYLIGPDGTRVELFTDVGGNGDHFTGTILDDQASVSITSGSAPFAGTYRPEGSLAALSGKNALGTWTLEITDDQWLYSGTLHGWSITITGEPMALLADGSSAGPSTNAAALDPADAYWAVEQVISWWAPQANVAPLRNMHVYVSDLPAGYLGLAWGQSLTLDVNANGAGWFVDSAPWQPAAFPPVPSSASRHMDLLTVVAHEVGHLLGYDHSDVADDLMYETLTPGTRRLPGSVPVTMTAMPRSAIVSSLLPERLDVPLQDLVDHALLPNEVDSNTGADGNLWILPLVTADGAAQPQRTPDTVRARIVKTIADEEMELFDEELLDLLAASQQ